MLEKELEYLKCRREPHGPSSNTTPHDNPTPDATCNPPGTDPRDRLREMDTVGLALSGGGIRSASVSLGFVQGLADLALLRRFDYLSTVSGGGYLGGWLSAWIHRTRDITEVESHLQTRRSASSVGVDALPNSEVEPFEISWLRAHSNYLGPRLSLGSPDVWVLFASYLRNLLLNQTMFMASLICLLLIPRFLLLSYCSSGASGGAEIHVVLMLLSASLLGLAAVIMSRGVIPFRIAKCDTTQTRHPTHHITWSVLLLATVSLLIAWFVIDGSFSIVDSHGERRTVLMDWINPNMRFPEISVYAYVGALSGAIAFGLFVVVQGFTSAIQCLRKGWAFSRIASRQYVRSTAAIAIVAAVCGASLGCILYLCRRHWLGIDTAGLDREIRRAASVLMIGPPTVLGVFAMGSFLFVGLMGQSLSRAEREWWARFGGVLLRTACVFAAFVGCALFGTPLLLSAGPTLGAWLTSSWAVVTTGGILAGISRMNSKGKVKRGLDHVVRVTPYVFLGGLLVILSSFVSLCVDHRPEPTLFGDVVKSPRRVPTKVVVDVREPSRPAVVSESQEYQVEDDVGQRTIRSYWAGILNSSYNATDSADLRPDRFAALTRWCWLWAICAAVASIFSKCVGVNTFSLHHLYYFRLVRCFLAASTKRARAFVSRGVPASRDNVMPRQYDASTGFDHNDDLELNQLGCCAAGATSSCQSERTVDVREIERGCDSSPDDNIGPPILGPYLLINTAMNLVGDGDLRWQERKAEAFLLSPMFCGSEISGYRPLPAYAAGVDNTRLTLGEAITISGAAASPNMGYHSSPAVTALLTLFNVRLGAWLPNPAKSQTWRNSEPRNSLLLLAREFLGLTDRDAEYVYLSDGGHFENLGVYELIRRHCRYIVAVDATADPRYEFHDLGGLIRKCRVDFGVPIEIDVASIEPGPDGFSKWHCAVGLIRYDYVKPKAMPGLLIYVKSSLSGDEPSDVLNYAKQNAPFPNQPTTDQFFSESQFESHRALGHHLAKAVFMDAVREVEPSDGMSDATHRDIVNQLFSSLRRRWFPPPPNMEENYIQTSEMCVQMLTKLREDPNLRQLSFEMFPELRYSSQHRMDAAITVQIDSLDVARSEVHMVEQVLEVMEAAWVSNGIDGQDAHPLNRGWMNAFRRWTNCPTFRKHWLSVRGEFSRDFVRFCDSELRLGDGNARCYEINERLSGSVAGDAVGEAWKTVCTEHALEWPSDQVPSPDSLLESAAHLHIDSQTIRAAWLIAAPMRWDASEDRLHPYGFIIMTPPKCVDDGYGLWIWIRGAYRNLGIGRASMKEVQAVFKGREVRTHLPGGNRFGAANSSQRAMWLAFFYHYGFRCVDKSASRHPTDDDLVLVKDK